MFWFRHPKPFNQRPVATQVSASKTQALPDMHVIVVESEVKKSPGAGEIAPAGKLART